MKLTDHLIVLSFDCLSSLDIPHLRELPHFQAFFAKASYCTNVTTIYPSVTYPCHTTIVTGKYPKNHGIINNTLLQPGVSSPDWYWRRSHIRGTTLYDEAKKAGMKTAALLWPVTARAKIDYNLPEIFANRPWHNQIAVSLCNGSPLYQLEMNQRFGHIRKGLNQPELDDFVLKSAVHTIKAKKPDLMLIHFVDLDSQRHAHGFSSRQAMEALHRHDRRLGETIEALQDAGIYENSTVILLGDHSALDETVAIKPNVLFREHGLIQVTGQGKVSDWKAYCKSCDGSAYVYLKDPSDTETCRIVKDLLHSLTEDAEQGIEWVLTGQQAAEIGADGDAAFMIEARLGFYIKESLEGAYRDQVTEEAVTDKKYTWASHGYSPKKENYKTVFMAAGKGIRQNVVLPAMHLADEGPTFARLLGLSLGRTDGRVLEEILENSREGYTLEKVYERRE